MLQQHKKARLGAVTIAVTAVAAASPLYAAGTESTAVNAGPPSTESTAINAGGGTPAAPADLESRIQHLESILQQLAPGFQTPGARAPLPGDLEARVTRLESLIQQMQSARAHSPGQTNPQSLGNGFSAQAAGSRPGGFVFQSADGSARLRVGGYIQADARFFTDYSAQTGTSSFLLRRVRPILEGTLYDRVDFRLMPDFGTGKAVIQDAYGEIRLSSSLRVRAGKFKPPVSLERLQSGQNLEFIERSIANNLAPNRDLGVQLSGDVLGSRLYYALGVFNGDPDGSSNDGDAGDDKDIALRLFAQPFKGSKPSSLSGLSLGVAASTGSRTESLSAVGYKTDAQSTFFRFDPAVVGAGTQQRVVPQVNYYNGQFGMLAEYIHDQQRAAKTGTAVNYTTRGWIIQGGWVLTGEKNTFAGITPAHPFGANRNNTGALELAARYSGVDIDSSVFTAGLSDPSTSASNARAATIGLNWYLNDALKLQWNYAHTDFNRPIKFSTGRTGHEDALLARMQISF